jgi:hypothetical protein
VRALDKLLELYNGNKNSTTAEADEIYLQSLLKVEEPLLGEFAKLKELLSSNFYYMKPLAEAFDALLLFRASEADVFIKLTQVDETLKTLWDQLSTRDILTPDDTLLYIKKFWDPVKNFVMTISSVMNSARCTLQEAVREIYSKPLGSYISTVEYKQLKYFTTTELEIQLYEHARAKQVMYHDDYNYYLSNSGEDKEILRKIAVFQQASSYRARPSLNVDYYMKEAGHPASKSLELLESHSTYTKINMLSKAVVLMPVLLEQIKALINSTHVNFDQAVTATFNNTNTTTALSLDYFNKLLPVNTRESFNALLPISSSSTAANRMRDSASANTTYRILPPLEPDDNSNLRRTPDAISPSAMTPADFRAYEIAGLTLSISILLLLLYILRPRIITKPVGAATNLVKSMFNCNKRQQPRLLPTQENLENASTSPKR